MSNETEDYELREQLAAALLASVEAEFGGTDQDWDEARGIADGLLPVVRRAMAEELRAVAKAIDVDRRVSEARDLGQAQRVAGEARSVVLERADALTALADDDTEETDR